MGAETAALLHAKRLIINISGSASASSSGADSGGSSGAKPSMIPARSASSTCTTSKPHRRYSCCAATFVSTTCIPRNSTPLRMENSSSSSMSFSPTRRRRASGCTQTFVTYPSWPALRSARSAAPNKRPASMDPSPFNATKHASLLPMASSYKRSCRYLEYGEVRCGENTIVRNVATAAWSDARARR